MLETTKEDAYNTAVNHVAHMILLLQNLSAFSTFALAKTRSFYTPERNLGLDFNYLFRHITDEEIAQGIEGKDGFWEKVKDIDYWSLCVRVLLARAKDVGDPVKGLHLAAITMQIRSIAPVALRTVKGMKETKYHGIRARMTRQELLSEVLLTQLLSFAGTPELGSLSEAARTSVMPNPAAMTTADIEEAALVTKVPLAHHAHVRGFAGGIRDWGDDVSLRFEAIMTRARTSFGDSIAIILAKAVDAAGQATLVENPVPMTESQDKAGEAKPGDRDPIDPDSLGEISKLLTALGQFGHEASANLQ